MTVFVLLLPSILVGDQEGRPLPPPLTEAQRTRLVKLVRTTRERAADLKDKIEKHQNELTRQYADFNLDVKRVEISQKEILSLQRQLLANYHHMQVELRSIVGRERFLTLQKRLARVLGVDGPKEQKKKGVDNPR